MIKKLLLLISIFVFGMNAIATQGVSEDVEPVLRVGQVLDLQYLL